MADEKSDLTPAEARAWLAEHGINQTELAKRMGCKREVIRDLLLGKTKGKWGDAHRAAVALRLKAAPKGESPFRVIPEGAVRLEKGRHHTVQPIENVEEKRV